MSIYDDSRASSNANKLCCGVNLNHMVIHYLNWTHRNSFAAVVVSMAMGFFAVTTFFALCVWALTFVHPTCIGGVTFAPTDFIDFFELSWTTFATVVSYDVFCAFG